jgi:hypothetical protein
MLDPVLQQPALPFAELCHTPAFQHHVLAYGHCVLPGNEPPWRDTGLLVVAGQAYSVFARGVLGWSARRPDLHGGPRFHLWARVAGGGTIVNLREDTDTFIADRSGRLELGLYMGVWANAQGDLASGTQAYARLSGALAVSLLVWRGLPLTGLTALLAMRPDLACLTAERQRLTGTEPPPVGWEYLLEAGHAAFYRSGHTPEGLPCIDFSGEDDQGILVRAVDFPLTPATRLAWRWRVDAQPSALAEDTPATHDYLSVAAEFDDGRDLTWIWSSTLTPGHHFACPIHAWAARETHWVTRSGRADFGQWVSETRAVHADVAHALGPLPARIVRIWLIVVATFQHGRFQASVADIRLYDEIRTLQVL